MTGIWNRGIMNPKSQIKIFLSRIEGLRKLRRYRMKCKSNNSFKFREGRETLREDRNCFENEYSRAIWKQFLWSIKLLSSICSLVVSCGCKMSGVSNWRYLHIVLQNIRSFSNSIYFKIIAHQSNECLKTRYCTLQIIS